MKTTLSEGIKLNLTKGDWLYNSHSATVIALGRSMKHEICTMNTYADAQINKANAAVIALSPKMLKYIIKLSEEGDLEAIELLKSLN